MAVGAFIGGVSLLLLDFRAGAQSDPPFLTGTASYSWPLLHRLYDMEGPAPVLPMGELSDRYVPYYFIKESSAKIFKDDAAQEAAFLAYARSKASRVAFNQRFQSLIIPKVTFTNATFDSAVEYLR